MTTGRRRVALGVLTGLYLVAAAVVGFWPTPVDRPIDSQINSVLATLHAQGFPPWFGYAQLEFLANVLFFVPIGLLLCLTLAPRFWYLAIVGGVLGSAAIEGGQLLFLPARYASWGDITANTIGATVGTLAVVLVRVIRAAHRARHHGRHLIRP